jgi:hypothetical protein
MPWQRTEARIVEMLQTYCDEPEKPVKDLTTWLERRKLRLLESLIRAEIEMKPPLPIGTATEAERRKIEEWFWQMDYRHIKLTELEQEFREIYEADGTNIDTIEQPNAVSGPTVKLQLSSPIVNQHTEKLSTSGFSRAHPESELIDEEEACAGITESTIDALTAALQVIEETSCAVDAIDGDYGWPVLRVQPTDRPPPQPGQELIDEEEACAVNATGADDVLLVLRVCAGITETTIVAFSTPIQHGYTVEKPLRGYALPAPQQTVSCRPPPKPGDVSRDTRAYGSTTATRRTIRLKASRRDRLGRVTARNGTEREGGRRTVKGEG